MFSRPEATDSDPALLPHLRCALLCFLCVLLLFASSLAVLACSGGLTRPGKVALRSNFQTHLQFLEHPRFTGLAIVTSVLPCFLPANQFYKSCPPWLRAYSEIVVVRTPPPRTEINLFFDFVWFISFFLIWASKLNGFAFSAILECPLRVRSADWRANDPKHVAKKSLALFDARFFWTMRLSCFLDSKTFPQWKLIEPYWWLRSISTLAQASKASSEAGSSEMLTNYDQLIGNHTQVRFYWTSFLLLSTVLIQWPSASIPFDLPLVQFGRILPLHVFNLFDLCWPCGIMAVYLFSPSLTDRRSARNLAKHREK